MTIDESMIKSKSRFVNFKQYMPLKPIKHGIKVFVLACGCSGYVYNWDVFQGRSSTVSGAVNLVVGRLITGNLIGSKRILYTDNYYTSIALAVTLYCLYGIYLVGTYAQKKNAKMTENAFPFAKLTDADAKVVGRGWMRRATSWVAAGVHKAKVQCICWKDSKVCGFISTAFIGYCKNSAVMRSVKGAYKSLKVKAHDVIINYLEHYGAVDRADRGMGDYSISVRASRWYMRVAFFALDVVIWNMWCIASFRMNDGDEMFSAFRPNLGVPACRYRFQLELADQLMAYGLQKAIEEEGSKEAVRWACNKDAGLFKSPQTPVKKVMLPRHHKKVRHGDKGNRHCQLCFKNKTCKILGESERRKQCIKTDFKCEACNKRMCDECYIEHHK